MAFTSLLMSLFPEISAAFWTESKGQGQFLFEHINTASSWLIWYLPTFSEHFGQDVGWLGTVQSSKYWFQRFIVAPRRLEYLLSRLRTAIWQIILKVNFKDHEMEVEIVWTFIRFIHKTDFCTLVKTRYWESEIVLVNLSYFIPP